MGGHRRNRALALAAAFLVVGLQAVPSSAGPTKKYSFTAHAYPFPTLDCGGEGKGIDGVTQTAEPFKTPSDGWLIVSAQDFEGDWDLAIRKGPNIIDGSYGWQLSGDPARERIKVFFSKGTAITIYACNVGSPQFELEVGYTFETVDLGY